jgi:hypothetical protein
VGHTVRAGTDVVRAIHEIGPRLFNVHVKDLTDFNDKERSPSARARCPFPKIFQALNEIGYKGFVDLEYEVHPTTPSPASSAASPICAASWPVWATPAPGSTAPGQIRHSPISATAFLRIQSPVAVWCAAPFTRARSGSPARGGFDLNEVPA